MLGKCQFLIKPLDILDKLLEILPIINKIKWYGFLHLNLLKIGHEHGHISKPSYEKGRKNLLNKHKKLKSKLRASDYEALLAFVMYEKLKSKLKK